jgi:hypothetical protein
MYYNENTTNHSTEELEVLAHSFFLEKWIAPYFQIIFEKIDNNLSERENVIKNVHQSRLGCKSSNSISCGNNSDEMEGSISKSITELKTLHNSRSLVQLPSLTIIRFLK